MQVSHVTIPYTIIIVQNVYDSMSEKVLKSTYGQCIYMHIFNVFIQQCVANLFTECYVCLMQSYRLFDEIYVSKKKESVIYFYLCLHKLQFVGNTPFLPSVNIPNLRIVCIVHSEHLQNTNFHIMI